MVRFIVREATYSAGSEFILHGGCTSGFTHPVTNERRMRLKDPLPGNPVKFGSSHVIESRTVDPTDITR